MPSDIEVSNTLLANYGDIWTAGAPCQKPTSIATPDNRIHETAHP